MAVETDVLVFISFASSFSVVFIPNTFAIFAPAAQKQLILPVCKIIPSSVDFSVKVECIGFVYFHWIIGIVKIIKKAAIIILFLSGCKVL
ncbi:membrane protein [Candidatus Magnetobacterium bavaricum]|nr:membrane protein [Candidatus Magnetobacterium bavaricum]